LDLKQSVIYVVGNKKDLGLKAVDQKEVSKYCKKRGFYHM